MKKVKVKQGQSIMDVALEYYGSISGVITIVEDNTSVISFSDNLQVGQQLFVREVQHKYKRMFEINPPAINSSNWTEELTGAFSNGFSNGFNI